MKAMELVIFKVYLQSQYESLVLQVDWSPKITHWARLRLPCGQTARSRWKEGPKPINKIRVSRNVKVCLNNRNVTLFSHQNT